MKKRTRSIAMMALTAAAVTMAGAADAQETLRYDWHLRGALSWVARVRFPTSGTGTLQTQADNGAVQSRLRVTSTGRDYIEYSSRMDESATRTLASANGYAFGEKEQRKETIYDYDANQARLVEREEGQTEKKTRPLPVEEARDVLTTIAYLREHAGTLDRAVTTDVYAEGKPYRVRIEPQGLKKLDWQGRDTSARVFRVVAAPGVKKKFPGLTVWLSEDTQRLPLRIVIEQQYASLDLKLRR